MRLSHGQAPRASELEYSERRLLTCSVMKQKALGWKHGVGTDIQESKKVAHKRGAWLGYVRILSSHEQR